MEDEDVGNVTPTSTLCSSPTTSAPFRLSTNRAEAPVRIIVSFRELPWLDRITLYLSAGRCRGFPHAPICDIGTIVSHTWSGSVNGAEFVLRNEARYGAPSSYVLERARSVGQRSHAPSTAVALVFSGNNEFIHLSPGRGRRGRGPALVSAEERYAIVELHRKNLEASVLELRRAGIEVVLSTIPTNLRDWPPSYTVLARDRAEHIERLYSDARDASRAGEAEGLMREILRLEPECAQAHFLLGRVHLAAGRAADARSHLVASNDFDGRPIRATSAINHNIRSLAAAHGIRLLDAEATFERRLRRSLRQRPVLGRLPPEAGRIRPARPPARCPHR